MNGNTTEVHKVELLCHVLQPLHLVLNLHLALRQACKQAEGLDHNSCEYISEVVPLPHN